MCGHYLEEDTTLPKEQMGQLRQVLISSFFRQVKEVKFKLHLVMHVDMSIP